MGKKKNDIFLTVDIESTCWTGHPPKGEQSEIIEIGIAPIDIKTLDILGKTSILIRPEHSSVSPFCTELTTITQEMLDKDGVSYKEALQILKNEFRSNERPWGSWGAYDRKMFERMVKLHNCKNPMSPRHINIKTLHSIAEGLFKECGMPTAVKGMGFNLDGTHHRGDDDAFNIAKVFVQHLKTMRM